MMIVQFIRQIYFQQNYMSVHIREKEVHLNGSQFYRANPYANQGYVPSYSLKNRKQPQFTTQIPQGIEFFEPSARKHYIDRVIKSQINQLQVFNSPQKYPMQNKIAYDKSYDRNMNTIDIAGANVNSKKPMAIRNRIKAQEELLRRNAKIITPLLATGPSEEDQCRKIAIEQMQRQSSRESQLMNKNRKYNSEKKLPAMDRYIRNPRIQMRDQEVQLDMTALQKELQIQKAKEKDQFIEINNPEIVTHQRKIKQVPVFKSNGEENIYNIIDNKSNYSENKPDIEVINGSRVLPSGSSGSSRFNQQIQQYLDRQQNYSNEYQNTLNRHQYRKFNPTNLSYEGNFIRNSSIFSGSGKNIALK